VSSADGAGKRGYAGGGSDVQAPQDRARAGRSWAIGILRNKWLDARTGHIRAAGDEPDTTTQATSGNTGSAGNQVTAAESNLQTALTGAKTYYTEYNQSYSGLDARTWANLDTDLTAVFGGSSTGPSVISIRTEDQGAVVELTALAPLAGGCFGILDVTAGLPHPAFPGRPSTDSPATYYFANSATSASACTASVTSAQYFSANGFDFTSTGTTGNTGISSNTGVTGGITGTT
jgi:hypothetical protein